MDYDTIADYFLRPRPTTPSEPTLPDSPARRLRDAIEPIATIGWWSREAATASTDLGHGFFDGYVWGRAAALGADIDESVVVAAFGVFEPTMLTTVLNSARAISTRDEILTARAAGAAAGLRAATAAVTPNVVEEFSALLLPALAGLDGSGRPLFSALRNLNTDDDAYSRAWRAAELVREHRGDGHIAASVAAGLDSAEMNVLTERWLGFGVGEYSSTRGFSAERIGVAAASLRGRGWLDDDGHLTDPGVSARNGIESATDESQHALVSALGADLVRVVELATTISVAILQSQAAPVDPRKRAAG